MIINKDKIKIGYQGDIGSNNEEAAQLFAQHHLIPTGITADAIEYIPLISSQQVFEALASGVIDFGVCAVRNNQGGTVIETEEALLNFAMKKIAFSVCAIEELLIHHCIYMPVNADHTRIQRFISHRQAFKQCRNYLNLKYPESEPIEVDDQAKAAGLLAAGKYPADTAVICKKTAGQLHGLQLIAENIEDSDNNITYFEVFILRDR